MAQISYVNSYVKIETMRRRRKKGDIMHVWTTLRSKIEE